MSLICRHKLNAIVKTKDANKGAPRHHEERCEVEESRKHAQRSAPTSQKMMDNDITCNGSDCTEVWIDQWQIDEEDDKDGPVQKECLAASTIMIMY